MNILTKEKVLIEFESEERGLIRDNRKGKGLVMYGFVCLFVLVFLCLNLVLVVDVKAIKQKRSELVDMRYNSEMRLNTLKKEVMEYKRDISSKEEDYKNDLIEKNEMKENINKLYKEKENEKGIIQGLKRERDVLEKSILGYEIELKYLQDELKQQKNNY